MYKLLNVFFYRFFGDLCTAVGGCEGNGGRPVVVVCALVVAIVGAVVNLFVLVAVVVVKGVAADGVGDVSCVCCSVTGVQIVGWITVAVGCGWK